MKKILQSLGVAALMTVAGQANAQTPDYGVYPGGLTLTDYPGGNTYDIDAILDAGTPVIIDMFAVWCGPCWNYHQAGTLEDVYNNIGDGGTGAVKIFAVEADGSTAESTMAGGGNSIGDWITGTDYPMCNDNGIASMMNLAYYPTLLLICPDRTVTEVGQASESAWVSAVNGCNGLATSSNDPRIIDNTSVSDVTLCGGGTASAPISVVVQNYSNTAINGSYTIEATIGASVVATTNATLNLQPYAATEVTVGTAALSLGSNNITVTITTANDDLTNDDISVPINVVNAVDAGAGDLDLEVKLDNYPAEVGAAVASGDPYIFDASAAYSAANGGSYTGLIDFSAIGAWSGNGSTQHIYLPSLATGCYHFIMFDDYGDGLLAGGTVKLISDDGTTNSFATNYGSMGIYSFEVTEAGDGGFTGVEEAVAVTSIELFPNPAVDMTNVQLNLNEASNVSIEMYNTLGQIVFSNNLGEVNGFQNVEVATADLESGMYLININVNGNIITKRVSVAK